MMKVFATIVAAITLSAAGAAAVVHTAGPSTAELDAQIGFTKTKIAAADAEASLYAGGLILVQIQLRAALLKNTLAMLEQKREAFFRGITLNYEEPTPRISACADDAAVFSELEKAREDVKAAQREAAMYSGGLIQAMALVREATAKTTEAAIEQRIEFMKLGIPLPALFGTHPPVPKAPGSTTSDKNAL